MSIQNTLSKYHKYLKINLLAFSLGLSSWTLAAESTKNNLELILSTLQKVENEEVQANMLKGVLDGLAGIKSLKAPSTWSDLNRKLSTSTNPKIKSALMLLNQKFGDKAAINKAFATLKDENASVIDRQLALSSLLIQKSPELLSVLKTLLHSPLQIDVIRALGAYEDNSIANMLMTEYKKMDSEAKRTTIETLATRKQFAWRITNGLARNIIQRNEIPAYVARNLTNLLGDKFTEVYGESKTVNQDKSKLISQYKAKLNTHAFAKADASRGRMVYNKTCFACHKMFGEGGVIGPDLTGSNRADQDYILLNIIDPSFDVPLTYRMTTITKKDGQILTGNIIDEDQQKIVLNMVGTKLMIPKSDISKRSTSKTSMMPEGLLDTLKEQEFLDLIKYLQAEKQVVVTK